MAEIPPFVGEIMEVGITEVCKLRCGCLVWLSTSHCLPCVSLLMIPLISRELAGGRPPGGSLAVTTRPS